MNTNQLLHQQQALHPSGGNVGPIPYISLSCLYLFPQEGPNPGPATQKRVIFPLAAATHCSMLSQCLQGSLSLPGFEETLIGQVRLPGRRNEHHHRSISSESARHTCSPPLPGVVGSCPPGADRSLKSAGSPPGREYGSAQGLSEEEDADGPKNSGVAMPSDCPANDEAGEVSVMIGGPVPKGEGGGIRNHWGALVRTCAQEKYMALVELQNRHGFYKRMHYDTLMDSDFASIRDSPPPDESVGTIDDLPESVTDAVRSAAEEMDCEEAMEALNGQTHIMTARYLPVSIPAAPPQLHSDSSVTTSTLKVMADACLERTFTCWASNGGQRMPTYPFPNISMNTLAILAEYLVKIFVLDVNSVVDLQICESAVGSPSDVSAGLTAEGDPDPNGVNAFLTGIEVVLAASLLGV